jgi:hypothetical protein
MNLKQYIKTSSNPVLALADAVAAPEATEETKVIAALGKARDESQARTMIQRMTAEELVGYIADGEREQKWEATKTVMEMAKATVDAQRRAAAAEGAAAEAGDDVADEIMSTIGVEFLGDGDQDDEMGSIKTSFLRNSTLLGMGDEQDIRELLLEEIAPNAETRTARAAVGPAVGVGLGGGLGALLSKFRRIFWAAAIGAAGAGALGALTGAASPAS